MAGVNGNSSARIYCQKIEAELLAMGYAYEQATHRRAAPTYLPSLSATPAIAQALAPAP